MAEAFTEPAALLASLGLEGSGLAGALRTGFPMRVPRGYAARMRHGDPADPLLRQVLPVPDEDREVPGYVADPVGDLAALRRPGLLHKYHGRVLLTLTGACAVHCRYCFRRDFPYAEANPLHGHWEQVRAYIAADPSIAEVILSGGDPLTLNDRRLAEITDALAAIGHVKRLRIHTRLPVVLPERVDAGLLGWLGTLALPAVMVIHANHAHEIDATVAAALAAVRAAGVGLLNQAVLLRGVNDSVAAQTALSEALFAAGVLPYYLHMLDHAAGTAHFAVDEERARTLYRTLHARLPGYLVPRLVSEIPGEAAKTLLFPF